jgi:hypothetical protein
MAMGRLALLSIAASLAFAGCAHQPTERDAARANRIPISISCPEQVSTGLCADGLAIRTDGTSLIERAYAQKNFAELDALFEKWSTGTERFPDGQWKLAAFIPAFARIYERTADWDAAFATLAAWQEQQPRSFAAKLVEAEYWRAYAWFTRGHGYADTVPEAQWALFRERLAKADATLDSIHDSATKHPSWYAEKLDVMIDRKAADASIHAVFIEGTKRFSEYHEIYLSAARHYDPRWGGSAQRYDQFAMESAAIAAKFEGPGMYARIYWIVDFTDGGLPFDPGAAAEPSWKQLHAGFEELSKRYPTSLWNLNQYASVACRSDDSDLYRQLRTRIAGNENEEMFATVPLTACDQRHRWMR